MSDEMAGLILEELRRLNEILSKSIDSSAFIIAQSINSGLGRIEEKLENLIEK